MAPTCTRFPRLFAGEVVPRRIECAPQEVTRVEGSETEIFRAWANILNSYAGKDDSVTFLIDDGFATVAVDTENGSIEKELGDYHGSGEALQDATGVFTSHRSKQAGTLALELHIDPATYTCRLHSSGHVPESHLPQILHLFHAAMQDARSSAQSPRQEYSSSTRLSALNDKPLWQEGPTLLHDLVSPLQVHSNPAIEFYKHLQSSFEISYQELDGRASQLAKLIRHRLDRITPTRRHVVPILIPQSPELYVAMLAVLRTGSAFCPLQLDAPLERLKFIIKDVDACLVLTTAKLASGLHNLPGLDKIEVEHDQAAGDVSDANSEENSLSIDPGDTAYIMYTSGSTGQPKGVPVSHRAATQSLLAHDRHIPKFSRFLQFAAPTFDVSIFEIFFTLFRSSTLVVCERNLLLDDLPRAMRDMHVDAAELTPTVAGGLLRSRKNAPDLKLLLTIGEMLTPKVISEFGGDDTVESILWGMYGPTEAAIHCTLQRAYSKAYRPSNIGIPLDTVSAFIVPPATSATQGNAIIGILPVGFVGELVVGGHQLADCYLKREQQTNLAFVKTKEHGMLYRTGDKARILLDGTIECLGRIVSGQVKLRGQRIELGEVRLAAARTPGCIDAVATIVNDNLIAFCSNDGHITSESILVSCKQWLPSFMMPTDIVLVSDLPRLPSGKVDVKALEQQYLTGRDLQTSKVSETDGSVTSRICAILGEALSRPVDTQSHLDTLGLDSLTAIKAASQLRRAGFNVSMMDLLSNDSNVHQLVRKNHLLEEAFLPVPLHSLFAKTHRLVKDQYQLPDLQQVFPCTALQLAMLVETEKNPSAYCNWIELEIDKQLSLPQVIQYFKQLGFKHSMLRSGFCQLDSTSLPYACVIHPALQDEQFQEVSEFRREFSMTGDDFLHPLKIQVRHGKLQMSLLMQLHHSIYDGWSIDVLLKDFQQVLDGVELQATPDFAQIANFYLQVDSTPDLDYWQDHLAGFMPTRLPNFNGTAVTTTYLQVEEASYEFGTSLAKLQQTSGRLKIGMPVLLQAALAQILGNYLGTTDVLFGTVTSGRSAPVHGVEEIFGPCLVTCPLRVDLAQARNVSDLLKHIHSLNSNMLQHAVVATQSIKQICDFLPEEPIWDVLFVWQESLQSREIKLRDIRVVASADRLECALTLEFEPKHGLVFSKATYHSSVLPRAQVEILLRQIDAVLNSMTDNLMTPLAGQESNIPAGYLSISNPYPDYLKFDAGLEASVQRHAREHPESIALIFARDITEDHAKIDTLTFKQLNDRSNQLAHYLSRKDLKSAELIAICMDKSVELYVAILAVIKLGLGYLPLTPSTPLKRIKTIVDEANVSLCLTYRDIFHSLPLESVCEVLNVDTVDMRVLSIGDVQREFHGSKPAYAVFTSGSTGAPKGVLVSQQNLLSNLAVLAEIYPTARGDRLLQACSPAFDVSVFEIFFAWQQGMSLCAAINDVLFKDLEMSTRALGITHLSLTPTVASLIHPDNVPAVKFLVTAGEGVTEKVKTMWSDRGLFQGYGPSETTNICTVQPYVTTQNAIRNIGRPFRNTAAFVLSPGGSNILPQGGLGEFCFGGDQVFSGYINQPELTESKFVNHPEFGRLYRSGDCGRILFNGSLMFAARLDDQVKIRGQRVELHEINSCILSHQSVLDCATIVADTAHTEAGLVSFIVPSERRSVVPTSPTTLLLPRDPITVTVAESLFLVLQHSLPSYMVPVFIVPIVAVPMTVQGKIDHRRLQLELKSLSEEELTPFTATMFEDNARSMSATEQNVLLALQETLGRTFSRSIRATSFFSLGLDSLSAIALARRVSKSFEYSVSISMVLRNPSIARLSHVLDKARSAEIPESEDVSIMPAHLVEQAHRAADKANADVIHFLPCTPLQEAMLSSSSSNPENYHNVMTFRIAGDVAHLKLCWQRMFERHEILRTTFITTNNPEFPFLQAVLRHITLPWLESDADVESFLPCTPHALESFKPPVQITILKKGSRPYMFLTCHHALYDGTAMSILLREVQMVYLNVNLPPPCNAEPLWRQIVAQRQESHISYWSNVLQDVKPILLKTNGHKQDSVSRIASTPLSVIEGQCQQIAGSLLSACQVAWAKTLSVLFDSSDVCFGNVIGGRSSLPQELDNFVFPTFNTVPFRIDLDRYPHAPNAVTAAHRLNAATMEHEFSPLRTIQSRQGFSETGILSSILLLQNSQLELNSKIWTIEHERGVMDFPLILELIPNRPLDALSASLYYNTSVLNSNEGNEIAEHFISVLCDILDTSNSSRHVPSLSRQLLDDISKRVVRPSATRKSQFDKWEQHDKLSLTEMVVARSISKLISIPPDRITTSISVHQLGLDSIGAIQLAASLRAQIHQSITAATVLGNPTIHDLAETIDLLSHEGLNAPAAFDIPRFSAQHLPKVLKAHNLPLGGIEALWPCTPIQMGMLFRFLRDGSTYVNHVTFSISRQQQLRQVLKSWARIPATHQILRTGFVSMERADMPYGMIVYKAGLFDPPVTLADTNFDRQAWRSENSRKFFENLLQPPWAVALEDINGALFMHISIFHGLYDATSLALILQSVFSKSPNDESFGEVSVEPLISTILGCTMADETAQTEHEIYWKEVLQHSAFNSFPDLNPLHVVESSTHTVQITLNESLTTIEHRCQTLGYSVQAVGQAAWARVLSTYLCEEDVRFGIVLSGRDGIVGADQAVFPCLITVPFAVSASGKTNDLLVRDTMVFNSSIRSHQFCRLADIQNWTKSDVLFDTIFAYQKIFVQETDAAWSVVEEVATDEYMVSLELEPSSGGEMIVRATFQTRVIPVEHAELLVRQYASAFFDILDRPEGSVADQLNMPMELLSQMAPQCPVLDSPVQLLHEFVERQVSKTPQKIAFEFFERIHRGELASRTWSYTDLNQEGDKVAELLRNSGVASRSYVGICFDKCPEASFAILGILKAGCAYIALDPSSPAARKRFIAEDSKMSMVLSTDRASRNLEALEDTVTVVYLDEEVLETPRSLVAVPIRVSPDDVCYCLYTSGTTGTPKGCEITHRNAVQAMCAFSILFAGRWNEQSKWLQFASFHFDVSVLEQYWSWSEGICVASAPRDLIFEDLESSIRSMGITHIDLTPSLASLVQPENVPELCKGVFITGGEQLKQEILDVWGDQEVIHNGYGPTETTIGVTMFTRVPKNGKPANIGKQFANVGTYVVLHGTFIPVMRGGVGELCISGQLVGKGYLNRAELTAEKFPFVEQFHERVYKTGDLVRQCYDGSFLFLGRVDDQVKLRGQRLEIGEINSTIHKAVPGLEGVSTYVLRHPKQQSEQLVGFIAMRDDATCVEVSVVATSLHVFSIISQARAACLEKLPGYMVPTFIIPITRMPLSTNNKTDGKVLKHLYDNTSLEQLQALTAVRPSTLNSTEAHLAKIISVFAGVPRESLHPNSNIFELGLDSVSVLALAGMLRKSGFRNVSISQIMSNATLHMLARAFDRDPLNSSTEQSVVKARHRIDECRATYLDLSTNIFKCESESIESIAPCTPLQEGMILRSLTKSHEAPYFNTFSFDLAQSVRFDDLQSAWQHVCDCVDILRTLFIRSTEGYVQVVFKELNLPVHIVEVNDVSEMHECVISRRQQWLESNNLHFRKPLEVVLWKIRNERKMDLNIFHGLYDGNCLGHLLSHVHDAYAGSMFSDPGPSFHEALAHGPLLERAGAQDFWTSRITSTPSNTFNTTGDSSRATQDLTLGDRFESCRRRLNVTHQAIVQAAWIATLAKILDSDGASTGIICSGRSIDLDGADRVIGPMFNTIPFSIASCTTLKWSSLVQHCHEFNVSSLPYQHTPLRSIQKWCRLLPRQGLFDSLFAFQLNDQKGNYGFRNSLWFTRAQVAASDYPLALEAEYSLDGSLHMVLACEGATLNGLALSTVLNDLRTAIRQILDHTDDPVAAAVSNGSTVTLNGMMDASKRSNGHATSAFEWSKGAREIREEISRLCNVDECDITENVSIFELGLDSIDVIKLSARLAARNLKLSVSTIMQTPSIDEMSRAIDGDTITSNTRPHLLEHLETALTQHFHRNGSRLANHARILPATPLQEGMTRAMLESGHRQYFNHDVLRLRPEVNETKLQSAWQTVFERTPILRTSLRLVDDPSIPTTYAQLVGQNRVLPWTSMRIASHSEIGDIIECIRQDADANLEVDTLFRLTMLHTGFERFLLISMPHSLYDGYSLDLIHHDVLQTYHTGESVLRPACDTTLETIVSAHTSGAASRFWSNYLEGATACRLEDNASVHELEAEQTRTSRLELLSEISAASIRAFCKDRAITAQTLGQCCFALVLAYYVRKLDVVHGLILAGRDTEDAQKLAFPTMNTIAFRSMLRGTKSEFLQSTQRSMANVRAYQHYPLHKAQQFATSEGQGLFNALFVFQSRPQTDGIHERLYESVSSAAITELPFCAEFEIDNDQAYWRVACHDTIFSKQESQQVLEHLELARQHLMLRSDEQLVLVDKNIAQIGNLPPFNWETAASPRFAHHIQPKNQDIEPHRSLKLEVVRNVISQVSRVPQDNISGGTTLYQLGLDSISAIKVCSLLKNQGFAISVTALLRASKIATIANLVTKSRPMGAGGTEVKDTRRLAQVSTIVHTPTDMYSIEAHGRVEARVPATAGQIYMLSHWAQSRGRLFFDTFRFTLASPDVSRECIQQAVEIWIANRPILRTTFFQTTEEDMPFIQEVVRADSLDIHFESFDSHQQTSKNEPKLGRFVPRQKANTTSTSRENDFMVAVSYEQCRNNTWKISIRIHHALYDGVSLPSLLNDLGNLILGAEITPSPTGLDTFTAFAARSAAAARSGDAKRFWTDYLQGFSVPTFEDLQESTDVYRHRFSRYYPAFIRDVSDLVQRARSYGTTVPSLFLAIYARILVEAESKAQITDDQDYKKVAIGIYIANRSHDSRDLDAYPTVNLLPILVDISLPLLEAAVQAQKDLVEISEAPNVDASLAQIEQWTGLRLNTFVNWVQLPDKEGTADELFGDRFRLRDEIEQIVHSEAESVALPQFPPCSTMCRAYEPAVDIEVALRDGGLDLGLFGPCALLTSEKVDAILGSIRSALCDKKEHT